VYLQQKENLYIDGPRARAAMSSTASSMGSDCDEDTDARAVTIDGVLYTAAIDFTAAVCGCTAQDAASKLSHLSSHESNGRYVSLLLERKHQFAGAGQRPIAVLSAAEMEELRKCLPNPSMRHSASGKRKRGFVYAGYSEGNGTKIGMTMRDDPKKRLKDANTYVKHPYELLDFIHCDHPAVLEGYIHVELDQYKVGDHNRELFELPDDFAVALFQGIKEELGRGREVSRQMVADAARASPGGA